MKDRQTKNPIKEKDKEKGSSRVERGGSWLDTARYTRVSYRYGYAPSGRRDDLGFRIARTIK